MSVQYCDVLVIGSGAAGLSSALHLSSQGNITVLSKGKLTAANTYYAQGGVAAVLDQSDSLDAHVEDTHKAGGGLCYDDVVNFTVTNGPDAIQWLISLGVSFTMDNQEGHPHLTQEGGHSHRRVIHAADATGAEISRTLIEAVKEKDNITLLEGKVAIDLILNEDKTRCIGAYVFDISTGHVDVMLSKATILATGGASKVYLYTSNPDIATGDGIAMAWRAGCRVANLEFNQFHPTCLYHPKAKSFLITEAIRGEGGKLLLPDKQPFMQNFDSRKELAPRDVVARAIDFEIKRLGLDYVYLDISHKPADFIIDHFPTVYAKCLSLGLDITRDPIPVVPAAHYTCGGVLADLQGRTDIPGLYAIGETACTGLHGANRMASNSLLECFVFAHSASKNISKELSNIPRPCHTKAWDESQVTNSDEDVIISHNWDELRRFMWDYVGIVRTDLRLQRARHRITLLQTEIQAFYSNYKISNDLLELRNLVVIAELIIRSAKRRKESRGLHYTLDYPEQSETAKNTILVPKNFTLLNPDLEHPFQNKEKPLNA